MKIVITGATGFVGRYVVAAALGRDHQVRAVVRPSSDAATLASLLDTRHGLPLGTSEADLRSRQGLDDLVEGADAVIHLAAAKSGDFYTQFTGTVVSTENLLAAMTAASVRNLVAISTFSVYDMLTMNTGAMLDESSPIDTSPERRDEYAQTKLLQEDLYRQFSDTDQNRAVIVRPGMIYGRDNLWHALLGADVGPRFVKIGSKATLPLAYVENAAEALVLAAEHLAADDGGADNDGGAAEAGGRGQVVGEVINLVDDNLPTQASYVEQVSAVIEPPPSVAVPWGVARIAAGTLAKANNVLVGGRAKFPGIVVPDRLHARFKPLRYTNAKAKRLLGWSPRYSLTDAIARSASDDDLLLATALNQDPTAPAQPPAARPAVRPVAEPDPAAERRPVAEPAPQPEHRPVSQPEHRPAPNRAPEAGRRPVAQPTPQPEHRSVSQPMPQPEHRPVAQPAPEPEHQPQPTQPSSTPTPTPGAQPLRSMLEELLQQPVEHPRPSDEEGGQ